MSAAAQTLSEAPAQSALGRAVAPLLRTHPGLNAISMLVKGADSLRARVAMIEAAEETLELQYYMLSNDKAGKIMMEAILRAADRGVKVRMLVDDLNLRSFDRIWCLLDDHENMEIRIFNPYATRRNPLWKRLLRNCIEAITRYGRRMHNKLMLADGLAALCGGRNVGDAYFDAAADYNFHDVDVLALGPVVPLLSASFEEYWNYSEAVPIGQVLNLSRSEARRKSMRASLKKHWRKEGRKEPLAGLPPLDRQLESGGLELIYAPIELAADKPQKLSSPRDPSLSVPGVRLRELALQAQSEFLAVTPYFVPEGEGLEWLTGLCERGVKLRILTNSLASIDAPAAHVGYAPSRMRMLRCNAELYEMKPLPGKRRRSRRFSSSSRSSLHSKVYTVDGRYTMIGSFNLDPRSVSLNTEIALVIDSPALASMVKARFEKAVRSDHSFHVLLEEGRLVWLSEDDGVAKRYTRDPQAGIMRRLEVLLLGLLPIREQV